MNVKKAIKKIVALGSGLTMIGATIMGATALDLGDYPAPFVQNGVFGGKIVVGANAATADVLGAIDISASLQAEAKSGVSVGGALATTTVSGGTQVKKSSTDFNWGEGMSTVANKFDDEEFPVLLADGVVEDEDGTDYDYEQELYLPDWQVAFGRPDTSVFDDPILYLDVDAQTTYLVYKIVFNDNLDVSALDEGESIEMFGTTWTFKNVGDADKVVLYGSDVTQLITLNSPVDVEVDSETYTLNIVGANAEASPAEVHVSVNGEVKSMSQGQTKTINGLQIYVLDVFVSTVGGESASAKVFIGSRELELEAAGTNTVYSNVKEDDDTLDGVKVLVHSASQDDNDDIDYIQFRIDPTVIEIPGTTDDYDYLELGETFTDPLFGFDVFFAEAVPPLMEDRSDFELRKNGNDLEVTFENWEGDTVSFDLYKKHSNGVNLTWADNFFYGSAAGADIADGKYFLLQEDAGNEDVTRLYEVENIDTGETPNEVTLRDLMKDESTTYQHGDEIDDTNSFIYVESATVVNVSTATSLLVRTKNDMLVTFEAPDSNNEALLTVFMDEDNSGVLYDEVLGQQLNFTIDIATDGDLNIITTDSWAGVNTATDDSGNFRDGVTAYGTFFEFDEEDKEWLKVYIPPEDVDYGVFINSPTAVISTSSSTGESTAYTVNPIGVGIGILDTAAPSLGSTPMIVVGGPCANTVAAELMGNPANCVEGFEEGKAVIRFYEDDNAILVAGFSATDTQGASRVLADYADYDLMGTEVEVVVPSLSSISINPVA